MPNETQGIRQWLTRLGEWAAHLTPSMIARFAKRG
jgi:hypothetical protein